MAGAGDRPGLSTWGELRQLRRLGSVALVERAGDREQREVSEVAQPVPDRCDRALPRGAKKHGQPARIVCLAAGVLGLDELGRLRREHRLALPAVDDAALAEVLVEELEE